MLEHAKGLGWDETLIAEQFRIMRIKWKRKTSDDWESEWTIWCGHYRAPPAPTVLPRLPSEDLLYALLCKLDRQIAEFTGRDEIAPQDLIDQHDRVRREYERVQAKGHELRASRDYERRMAATHSAILNLRDCAAGRSALDEFLATARSTSVPAFTEEPVPIPEQRKIEPPSPARLLEYRRNDLNELNGQLRNAADQARRAADHCKRGFGRTEVLKKWRDECADLERQIVECLDQIAELEAQQAQETEPAQWGVIVTDFAVPRTAAA
jgi:hypothetical protein